MTVKTKSSYLDRVQELLSKTTSGSVHQLMIVTSSNGSGRSRTTEFYGNTSKKIWRDFLTTYREEQLDQADSLRIDLMIQEEKVTYKQLMKRLSAIKRNNYIDFNLRFACKNGHNYTFLMEELVANAIIKPSKTHIVGKNMPELSINDQNFRGYMKRKYAINRLNEELLSSAELFLFQTKAFYLTPNGVEELCDYGNGNRVRKLSKENEEAVIDLVIRKGSDYLKNQLKQEGNFIYGYYPCYGQLLKGYNSVRHFSSLYALAEAAEYTGDSVLIGLIKQGLNWGVSRLVTQVDTYSLVKEGEGAGVEYKLGAQATAILALSKYTELTGEETFLPVIHQLTRVIEEKFLTPEKQTIHVLDQSLAIKERFRIIYYDGETLFALLRAYKLTGDQGLLQLSIQLMDQFVAQQYQKYHDHWLSYATNELLEHRQSIEYYRFGIQNALVNIRFIERRDTAYPTMLELLVAASKMMDKLAESECQKELFTNQKEFDEVQGTIERVMEKRARHEITTGVMFPEFAQFFKFPEVITYGFFARHDRFRMRIDDAEHFLSGLINYQYQVQQKEGVRGER